jgi:arabinan endo-1,5-alpha-L-arabinosidase
MQNDSRTQREGGQMQMRPAQVAAASCVLVTTLMISGWVGCGGGGSGSPVTPPITPPAVTTFSNPVMANIATGGRVESCADPSIIRNDADNTWYAYCTGDPLNDSDKDARRNWRFHGIAILKSTDLATWAYAGDVFSGRPAWVATNGGLWAPAIKHFGTQYYLYYAASVTNLPGGNSAIGVATSNSPAGPWTDSGGQVVEPGDRATIDPEVIDDNGQKYIYYGSFWGGIHVRKLSADGLHSDATTDVLVAIGNRYEAPNVVKHGNSFYMFLSASNCCNGPLSGYAVYVGRSATPVGPFVDRDGIPLTQGRAGGTLAQAMNGSRWVGPGHNAVFTDMAGQDWTVYHAIDRNSPYFAGSPGFTKRPLMMDAVDWVNEWPVIANGNWVSETAQGKPAAQVGEPNRHTTSARTDDLPGTLNSTLSDEFNAAVLGSQWTWMRQPAANSFRLNGSGFELDTQGTELNGANNTAGLLLEAAPVGDYMVETRMQLNVPAEGCCQNYAQAGVVIYGTDDNYLKLVLASVWETRQIEFGKEMSPVPAGYPMYGSTFLEAPGEWTWLRLVKRVKNGVETFTPYSSRDGVNWARGGSWTHSLGVQARIGLLSMNAAGFTATFDYVRVYSLGN